MDRVFSDLRIRSVNEDQRIIEGIASTPRVDRMGDIVEPLGAEYDLPIPLLLDHDHSLAVGEVEMAEVTPAGIRFRARIKKITEPGLAKDLVDKAWHLLKHGLRKCVSIGFRVLASEPLSNGGRRYTRWEWFELSACSVPANPDAVITGTKRIKLGRDIGKPALPVVKLTKKEMLIGKWKAEAKRRIEARKRLGIPLPVVKLEARHIVTAQLQAAKQARGKKATKPYRIVKINRTR